MPEEGEFVEGFIFGWLPSPIAENIRTHVLLGSEDMQLAGDISHVHLKHHHYPVVSVLPDTFVRGSCCTNHLCSAVLIAVYKSVMVNLQRHIA